VFRNPRLSLIVVSTSFGNKQGNCVAGGPKLFFLGS
jgi:hypothetical protein